MDGVEALITGLAKAHPGVDRGRIARLVRTYGTKARDILGGARADADLGRDFGGGLTEAEVRYLVEREWAQTAEDVLWRRSKLGLAVSPAEVEALEAHLSTASARWSAAAQ